MADITLFFLAAGSIALSLAIFASVISYRGNWHRLGNAARSRANSTELIGTTVPGVESLASTSQPVIGNSTSAQVTPLFAQVRKTKVRTKLLILALLFLPDLTTPVLAQSNVEGKMLPPNAPENMYSADEMRPANPTKISSLRAHKRHHMILRGGPRQRLTNGP